MYGDVHDVPRMMHQGQARRHSRTRQLRTLTGLLYGVAHQPIDISRYTTTVILTRLAWYNCLHVAVDVFLGYHSSRWSRFICVVRKIGESHLG